jgi:exosortase K
VQVIAVLLCALTLKQFYSTANVNELRWILAPTTLLVELVSGSRFQFEPYAGYINTDRTFIIAASCAGVNFLLTAFLMLSLITLWQKRSQNVRWRFIPMAGGVCYVTTIVANTARIAIALWMRGLSFKLGWLDPDQLHRVEGITIYFSFLFLLFVLNQKVFSVTPTATAAPNGSMAAVRGHWSNAQVYSALFPLLVYYAVTIGIPLITALYRPGTLPAEFVQHLFLALLVPLVLLLPLAVFGPRRS